MNFSTPSNAFRLVVLASLLALLSTPSAHAGTGPGPGDAAPPALGTDIKGEPVNLSQYVGKAVIVTFWATWCSYCLKELPILENIQNKAGKAHMQVIAVNTESREVFRKASRVMKSLSLMVTHDTGSKAFTAYGGTGLPHMAIIGRDGNIIRIYQGYDESSLHAIVKDVNQALMMPVQEKATETETETEK